jgi:hypothetical protein
MIAAPLAHERRPEASDGRRIERVLAGGAADTVGPEQAGNRFNV